MIACLSSHPSLLSRTIPHTQTSHITVISNNVIFIANMQELQFLRLHEWWLRIYFKGDAWVKLCVRLSQQMVAIISHPSTGILEIVWDLARLLWLDTHRKANRVGLPDCDSEICFSLDRLVSACPAVSASEKRIHRTLDAKAIRWENIQGEP